MSCSSIIPVKLHECNINVDGANYPLIDGEYEYYMRKGMTYYFRNENNKIHFVSYELKNMDLKKGMKLHFEFSND